MAQPIGKRIIEIVTILDAKGPMTCPQLEQMEPQLPPPVRANVRNLCSRAYSHKLATMTLNAKGKKVYAAAPGWRDKLPPPKPAPVPEAEPAPIQALPAPWWQAGRPEIRSVFVNGINPFDAAARDDE